MFRHSAAALDFCSKLEDLVLDQSQWSQATFGSDAERGPVGALKHLTKESEEAVSEAWKCYSGIEDRPFKASDDLKEELADCFLLLLDATRRSGLKIGDLIDAGASKMEKNKQRTWPKPTSDEPVEHVR